MSKHELWELQSMQAAPLSVKISMTKHRIREWVNTYGEDGVYVSFSGGKDSTVLLNLVREEYPNVPAVFCAVPTQYPELEQFAKTFDNVEIVRPKMNFFQVCEKYGFPLISKEVSERVYYAQKYLTWWKTNKSTLTDRPTAYSLRKFLNLKKKEAIPDNYMEILESVDGAGSFKIKELLGKSKDKNGNLSMFNYSNYIFFVKAPFMISNRCCDVMKKSPMHQYQKRTGRNPMTAVMASESRLRAQKWLQHGCNGFDMKSPISMPMAFWTEQDVLLYIYQNHIPICSVYGDVVKDTEVEGQLDFEDLGIFDLGIPVLKTTGCDRTGCVLCGFGCHLEKPGQGRFERLKETHPGMYKLLDIAKNNGVTMREAIDWTNEHGNLNIKY